MSRLGPENIMGSTVDRTILERCGSKTSNVKRFSSRNVVNAIWDDYLRFVEIALTTR
jgi:hypothetical protein